MPTKRKKPELHWLRANCPVCGREYEYFASYKPETCGEYTCIHIQAGRKRERGPP